MAFILIDIEAFEFASSTQYVDNILITITKHEIASHMSLLELRQFILNKIDSKIKTQYIK